MPQHDLKQLAAQLLAGELSLDEFVGRANRR